MFASTISASLAVAGLAIAGSSGSAGAAVEVPVNRGKQRSHVDAAEDLLKGGYPRLAGWVRQLVDDDDIAHEIASEAFVRLLGRLTKVECPQSYLYTIAASLIRDRRRQLGQHYA
jgi:RNA polymerase sigma-70 factor (ECF subfamily)